MRRSALRARLPQKLLNIYRKETFLFFVKNAKRTLRGCSLGIFMLFPGGTATAQDVHALSSTLQAQLDEVDFTHYYTDPDSALLLYKQIATVAAKNDRYDAYLDAHLRMAWCGLQHNRIDTFQYFLNKAEAIAQQNQTALDTLDAHRAIRVNIPYTQGLFYETTGDYIEAIAAFRPIVVHPEQYQDSLVVSDTYYELGLCYHALENYSQAITYRQLALQWLPRQVLQQQFSYHQALLYLSIGTSYDQRTSNRPNAEEATKAKYFYDTSLKILLGFAHSDRAREAIITNYQHLSGWYMDRNRYDSALWQLDQSLRWYASSQTEQTDDLVLRGDINLAKKEYALSRSYYERALAVAEKVYTNQYEGKAKIYRHIGQTYLLSGQLDQALGYFQQALIEQIANYDNPLVESNPTLEGVHPTKELLESLSSKAFALYLKSKAVAQDTTSLLLSLDTYQLTASVIDQMRQTFPSLEYKQFISAKAASLYEQAIKASLRAYELGLTQKDFLAEAFYFSEKGKATTLLEAVKTNEARAFADISPTLLAQENQLKRELTYWENQLYQADKDSTQRLFRNRAFETREAYNVLVKRLEEEYPNYYQLKYDTDVVGVAELQAQLPENAALVSFSYGDSTLYAFTVHPDAMHYHTVPLDSLFPSQLENVLQTVSQYDFARADNPPMFRQFTEDAHQLYQTLVQPSLEACADPVKQLIIIPDGLLGYLPFDVLLTGMPTTPAIDYQRLPYLVKQLPISYEYSATLLAEATDAKQETSASYLGFAPSYQDAPLAESREGRTTLDGQWLGLGQLRYNREEVAFAADLFGGEMFTGDEATETNFKQQAGQGKLLHLSMHAYAHDKNGDFSGLIFTQQGDSTQEDGFLHSNELYNLSLRAELAVLSACQTGIGTLAPGEGIMSLGRAFKYAGCPNVTMSLWNADDQSTNHIMQYFFAHLHGGLAKDEALRRAKLDYLGQARSAQAHPYYWAAFVQLGDRDPLSLEKKLPVGWWMGGTLVVLFLLAIGKLLFLNKLEQTRQ